MYNNVTSIHQRQKWKLRDEARGFPKSESKGMREKRPKSEWPNGVWLVMWERAKNVGGGEEVKNYRVAFISWATFSAWAFLCLLKNTNYSLISWLVLCCYSCKMYVYIEEIERGWYHWSPNKLAIFSQ